MFRVYTYMTFFLCAAHVVCYLNKRPHMRCAHSYLLKKRVKFNRVTRLKLPDRRIRIIGFKALYTVTNHYPLMNMKLTCSNGCWIFAIFWNLVLAIMQAHSKETAKLGGKRLYLFGCATVRYVGPLQTRGIMEHHKILKEKKNNRNSSSSKNSAHR